MWLARAHGRVFAVAVRATHRMLRKRVVSGSEFELDPGEHIASVDLDGDARFRLKIVSLRISIPLRPARRQFEPVPDSQARFSATILTKWAPARLSRSASRTWRCISHMVTATERRTRLFDLARPTEVYVDRARGYDA